jgi:hypothetical protein
MDRRTKEQKENPHELYTVANYINGELCSGTLLSGTFSQCQNFLIRTRNQEQWKNLCIVDSNGRCVG